MVYHRPPGVAWANASPSSSKADANTAVLNMGRSPQVGGRESAKGEAQNSASSISIIGRAPARAVRPER